jgi:hypothetical protein
VSVSARLIIRRPKQLADMFRRYKIVINQTEVASLKRGEDLSLDLPGGTYLVQAKIDWCSSRVMTLHLADGETFQLEVGSNLGGWKSFAALLFVTALPSDYLYLRKANYGFPVLTADPE